MTTDLFRYPWLDRTETASPPLFETGSVANLVLFDVWHHLEFPGMAMEEFRRVLIPRGRIIIFDPAAGILGKFIYSNFHHEPLGLDQPIPWMPTPGNPFVERYYASQGNAWRMFYLKENKEFLSGWNIVSERYLSALAYIGTGGFSGPQLYPRHLRRLVDSVDSVLSRIPRLFATRMLVALEKA